MKRNLCILVMLIAAIGGMAQKKTLSATVYKQFKPSVVTFADGHKSNQSLTNVFLKNSSLLFMRGDYAMEATMDNIVQVDFDDRSYTVIDKQMAYLIDSVNGNALFCVELFDQQSYEQNLRNNVNISNLDLGDQISTATVNLNTEEDYKLPVFRHFYFRYQGEFIKVHERELGRKLPKEKKTMMKRIVAMPGFSWQKDESLITLLKAITD